jgi:Bacterial SH3 domain
MKHNHWLTLLALGIVVCGAVPEQTAEVRVARANVRGKPSVIGEVITQLKRGDKVTVLEEIRARKPAPGEPAQWDKIKMPDNTPLWVFADFIDPTNKTVKVRRLNVRGGAGQNYSVVGRLEKGTAVKPIRVVEDWMEVETPTNAYAFIDAALITKPEAPVQPAEEAKAAEEPKPVPPPVVAPAPTRQTNAPTETVKAEPEATPTTENVPAPAPTETQPPAQVKAASTPSLTNEPPVTVATPAQPVPAPAPPPVVPKVQVPRPKRIVVREGRVRRTTSIQAPTSFELFSRATRMAIDYLHSPSTNLVVKAFKGKDVIVRGEEFLDPRWPETPVLELQSIRVAP